MNTGAVFGRNVSGSMKGAATDPGGAAIPSAQVELVNATTGFTTRRPSGSARGERLQFRSEFYNAFNHTQFRSLDTGARFDQTGKQVNAGFGSFTVARSARVISFAPRFKF